MFSSKNVEYILTGRALGHAPGRQSLVWMMVSMYIAYWSFRVLEQWLFNPLEGSGCVIELLVVVAFACGHAILSKPRTKTAGQHSAGAAPSKKKCVPQESLALQKRRKHQEALAEAITAYQAGGGESCLASAEAHLQELLTLQPLSPAPAAAVAPAAGPAPRTPPPSARGRAARPSAQAGALPAVDANTIATVMDACASTGDYTRAQAWFDRMVEAGIRPDVFTHHTLIKAYARGGDVPGAERCLLRARQQSVKVQAFGYNAVIAAAAKAGDARTAHRWLYRLLEDGVDPDAMSYNSVVDAWAKKGEASRAEGVLQLMLSGPVKPDVVTIGMVLHACAKAGDAARAEGIFAQVLREGCIVPDAICFNAMINASVKAGDTARAEHWLGTMLEDGIAPSVVSYTTVIHAHARAGDIEAAEHALRRMLRSGVQANVVTFSALIQACAKTGDVARAEEWFHVMRSAGVQANDVCFSAVLNVCAKASKYERAEYWLRSMEEAGVVANAVCYNNVIDACTKAGRPECGEGWLRRLVELADGRGRGNPDLLPTRKTYTIAAQGYASGGRWQDVERLMAEMGKRGIGMDEFSLTVLLSSYWRASPSQPDKAEEAFRKYVARGLPVTVPPVRVLRWLLGAPRAERLLAELNVKVPQDKDNRPWRPTGGAPRGAA